MSLFVNTLMQQIFVTFIHHASGELTESEVLGMGVNDSPLTTLRRQLTSYWWIVNFITDDTHN